MKKKLSVAFLWHMHQPMYKDLVTEKYFLPWVRLHSTYSYLDMASSLEEFPLVKVTFNFTPSLLWQLKDIADSDHIDDEFLLLTERDPKDLIEDEKIFILKNFFSCDMERAILTSERYKQLLGERGENISSDRIKHKARSFSDKDLRDLQVLFNLAWCGFTLREKDGFIRELVKKGEGYTEAEKKILLKKQKKTVASIIPLYKDLQDQGRIEISTSPFYHPILPLLCGMKEGADFTEDAEAQIRKAVDLYSEIFGRVPKGMWPPEGGVSPQIISLLSDAGIKWMAADEGIVIESFKGENIPRERLIYRAFNARKEGKGIDVVFRDINLSNAVSFRYSRMKARKAAEELVHDIRGIYRTVCFCGEDSIAAIILDGENPWPYYENSGKDFIFEIYDRLSKEKDVKLVTMSEFFEQGRDRKTIDNLFSGSWIDRNFNKWIGSPQKNKAWELLQNARKDLLSMPPCDEKALEELYIAEGSDWFWWYDDFGNELNFMFDELFRRHLRNIYDIAGKKVPDVLKKSIPVSHGMRDIEKAGVPLEMAGMMKVVMVSSEVFPFAKTGGLADVSGSLPKELASLGCEVSVFMPFYKCVKKSGVRLKKVKKGIKDQFLGKLACFDLYEYRDSGVTFYFIEHTKYFNRDGLYGTADGDYPDNALRFSFFSKAVLVALKTLGVKPDIIHCNDWPSALIPFYLKFIFADNAFYKNIKTLFTIHNMAYQGIFNKSFMPKMGIPDRFFNMNDLEFYGRINLMKSGILYSDTVSTVSRSYAKEIMTPEYGAGLDGLLRTRKEAVYGIPNGVDYGVWSPENDKFIKVNFSAKEPDKKTECKKDIIKYTGLSLSDRAPLLGSVTRLAEQKGMDLVAEITKKIVSLGAGMIILGTGNEYYNKMFLNLEKKYPGAVYVCNDFNDELAHKIEAGCDIFLMPSRYEPCGLNQMYSIKYGTIPVVRATGGLDDVIVDFDEDKDKGNGFKFGPATKEALLEAVERALFSYQDKEKWNRIMRQAMSYDFSWHVSAEKYVKLYRKIVFGD
ncbi:MAG: glycogen synthase GlgA [Candidatus Omnitrophota bacterium]